MQGLSLKFLLIMRDITVLFFSTLSVGIIVAECCGFVLKGKTKTNQY